MWLADGTKVEVVSENPLIITEMVMVEDYDGVYESEGRTYAAARGVKLYETPPVKVLNEEVARLYKEIDALKRQRQDEKDALHRENIERAELIAKLSKADAALETLADVFDANITHFVSTHYSYEILLVDELAKKLDSRYDSNGKYYLMHLYLTRNSGGAVWEIRGQYERKYGDYLDKADVIPCSSYEQAQAVLQKHIDEKIAGGTLNEDIVKAAEKYGLVLPDDYRSRLVERDVENIEKEITRHQREIAKAEVHIAALRQGE